MDARQQGGSGAGFETIEHTADVGLRIWGRTLEELFEQAAIGLVSLLVEGAAVRASEEREISIDASDAEDALIRWLQELLYFYEIGGFVPSEVSVVRAGADGIRARVRGERFDRDRHERGTDIKAATYHDLDIRRVTTARGIERWECVVIFDT